LQVICAQISHNRTPYQTFNARSSKSKGVQKGVHFAEVNLNEDESNTEKAGDGDSSERESEEEEEESGEDDEFINVLDVLDGRGKDERPVKKLDSASAPERTASKEVASGDEMSEEEGSGDEEEDEEEPVYEDEDDADEDAIGRLNEFVSGLSTTAGMKRKADEGEVYGEDGDATASKYKKKKKLLKDRTEGVAESEFGARTAGTHSTLTRISFALRMLTFDPPRRPNEIISF
jgi:U3 small nucleolar RNA-associated protein 14